MPGATGPKRTPAQREADLTAIAAWYVRGWTQQAMAERLAVLRREAGYTVSRPTVARDIDEIQRRWVRDQVANFDARRAREVAKIDELERTYWEAWERSTRPREVSSTQQAEAGERVSRRASLRREERDGNLGALQGVERCIALRVRLFGLEAREVVDEMVRREAARLAREYGMDVDDVLREANEILRGGA